MTELEYSNAVAKVTIRVKADPFAVADWVARRLHPNIDHDAPDPDFDRLMARRAREAEERRLKGRKKVEENMIPRSYAASEKETV